MIVIAALQLISTWGFFYIKNVFGGKRHPIINYSKLMIYNGNVKRTEINY